jgi:hypothetical protein
MDFCLERGLPPLPDPNAINSKASGESSKAASTPKQKAQTPSLSFSSSKGGSKPTTGKRKAIGDAGADEDKGADTKSKKVLKKAKKAGKTLLSFGDDEP